MPRRPVLLIAAACVLIAVVIAVSTFVTVSRREAAPPETAPVVSTGQPDIGGPFQLVDQDGRAVDQSVLNGKWSLVFFGFTYCPDYCPTTLNALAATQAELGDAARDLQILFITVDPARDTPEALKQYLSLDGFPKNVVGLTGTPEQVAAAARTYRASYDKVGDGPDYTMNHTVTVYVMGPDGRFRVPMAHDLGPDRAAILLSRVMARG